MKNNVVDFNEYKNRKENAGEQQNQQSQPNQVDDMMMDLISQIFNTEEIKDFTVVSYDDAGNQIESSNLIDKLKKKERD